MKRIAKYCPKCGCGRFYVTAIVAQRWMMDSDGDVMDVVTDCEEVSHKPNDTDIWQCADCGYRAVGEEFNTDDNNKKLEDLLVFMLQDIYKEKGEAGVAKFAQNYGCSQSAVQDILHRLKTAPREVRE